MRAITGDLAETEGREISEAEGWKVEGWKVEGIRLKTQSLDSFRLIKINPDYGT